jgi:flagellar hook-length control protein FliK
MPIAFDSPASAPHGTLPVRAGREQDDDASALDAFALLFLAAAGAADGSPVAASDAMHQAPKDEAASAPADAPFLMLPLPGVPTLSIPVPGQVTIVASEKRVGATAPVVAAPVANVMSDAAEGAQATAASDSNRDGEHAARSESQAAPAAPDLRAQTAQDAPKPRIEAPQPAPSLLAALASHADIDKATSARPEADRVNATSLLVATAPPPHVAAAAPAHAEAVATPAFTAGWQDEAVAKLAHIVVTRNERAELTLNPAELGPVSIRVDMNADHASLQIVAASPETRTALEQSLPQLRDLLASQGITLGQASVHDGSAQRDAPSPAWLAATRDGRDAAGTRGPADETVERILRRADRLLDVFA